jgi:UDP-2,4-diacetamido-2,4,6-trideoxy-beta-L-altropyranose hydrolase
VEPDSVLKIRSETDDDCRLLWEWANDPGVRSAAFSSDPVAWEEHVAWFRSKRADPRCRLYILSDQVDRPVGQVRLDLQDDGSAVVTISIAPEHRGRGYGAEALRLACERFFATAEAERAVAYVKPDNLASLRAFDKAGFTRQGTRRIKGHDAVLMILQRAPA